jgi:hypothetical protein
MERLMAQLYLSKRIDIESSEPIIRKLEDDGGYAIAVEIPIDNDENEDAVCELCFTEDEVSEMYDAVFNR